MVKEALKLIRSTLPTTIELSQSIDPNCDPVMGDPTQIHQIVMNLCTNAYHAMQENGGTLEVTLREVRLGAGDISAYPGAIPGTYLKLSVSDTGVGIPKEILDRIFDPFFTTKPVGRGTGLGLSVVHGIVRQMGGHIGVYSELGKGTVFQVLMPAVTSETVCIPDPSVSKEIIPTGSERILLVDDEKPILSMLEQMLEKLGYGVTSHSDPADALRAFQNEPDGFDLVITDMTMPNMTGAQLARKILEIRADMPIILCTGFSEQINVEKSEALGIRGYLMKPVIRGEMAKMIRKVSEG
jgi:CheY-like chemotaxis protein